MATRANLIATYNSNPTLQNQYTQQQYLDLFDFSTPTTTTATTTTPSTTTTPAATTGIQNIIGQDLNQGGGGGGGIQGLTLNTPSSARTAPINSAAFRDPLNEKIRDQIADQMRKQNPNLESRTNAEIIASNPEIFNDPEMFNIKTDRGFFQNTVDNIGSAYKAFKESPIGIGMSFMNPASALASIAGMMGRKDVSEIDAAFNRSGDTYTSAGGIGNKDKYGLNKVSLFGNYAEKVGEVADETGAALAAAIAKLTKQGLTPAQIAKRTKALRERNEYYEEQRKRRERERMEASAANRAAANKITERLEREFREDSGGGFDVSGPDTSANPTGASNRASQERGFALHGAKGGSVPTGLSKIKYNDGGRVYLYNRLK